MTVVFRNNKITWFLLIAFLVIPKRACPQVAVSKIKKNTSPFHYPNKCKTDEVVHDLFKSDPTYLRNWELLNRNILQIQSNQSERLIPGSLYIIPTVVHIIHNNGAENITNAQVISQITRVNEDYRKIVATLGFGAGVDTKIEFCLATIDPTGNPTTGITRNQSTMTNNTTGGGGNEVAMKNLNRWPTDRYLNIWIVRSIDGGAYLGYAYLPPAPISVDGIVIAHWAFGNIGTAAAPYNLGRTLTHEAGHYLNLLHTFQNGCVGRTAATCATAGDLVCDTPPTQFANYGCPGPQNTCTETPTDSPDQTRNYMDYTDDACMDMFTSGQTVRLQAVMTGTRANLTSLANLISVGCAVVGCSVTLTSKTDVLCPCEATGAINITGSSSDTPISYNWSNGATLEDLTNISAATYTVTITDSKSCTATLSTTITEPTPIVITLVSQTNIACFGKSTGQIVVRASGATAPFDFSIDGGAVYTFNNIASATSVTFSILPAGVYSIKVRDGNNCITQP